jgi:hypothetical protein
MAHHEYRKAPGGVHFEDTEGLFQLVGGMRGGSEMDTPADGFGALAAEAVPKDTPKAVERRTHIVVPGFDGKVLFFLCSALGTGVYPRVHYLVAGAHRKVSAQKDLET